MNILLTNDDGLFFVGIQEVYKQLAPAYNTYLCAPAKEYSGSSNAISLHNEIEVTKVNDKEYIVNGFPADCVNISINTSILFEVPFDLVISGINKGQNLGTDTIYSGTVGAARQALVHNIPSIAISCNYKKGETNFVPIASFLYKFIKKIQHEVMEVTQKKRNTFLYNINVPINSHGEIPKVIEWAKLGKRHYKDEYVSKQINEKTRMVQLNMLPLPYGVQTETGDTDVDVFLRNHISITPLSLDATDYNLLEKKKGDAKEWND